LNSFIPIAAQYFLWGGDSERGNFRVRTTLAKYPIGKREPRAFGVEDRPPCPSCGAEMHLFRRSPAPGHHAYEVQIFSCMKCDAEMTRSADRKGKPHSSAVSIELETLSRNVARRKGLLCEGE
jgi:hypothetical protein